MADAGSRTYGLISEDAHDLWSLANVVKDRRDDQHAALLRLAKWLDDRRSLVDQSGTQLPWKP
jgi:hypothetical protein